MWLARLTSFAANCNLLIVYLGYFWPGADAASWRAAIMITVVVSLTVINIIGVRDAARASNVFTIALLAPLILFIAAGMFRMARANFSLQAEL